MNRINGPHQGQRIVRAGVPLASAKSAMVMVHGRGATAESILELSNEFDAGDFAFLAPQASGNTWYPNSFLAPIETNEPGISSGIQAIQDAVREVESAGIPSNKIIMLGFSQGACLALEFAARNVRQYGGIVGLSGGLIGPAVPARKYAGSFAGTPVFLGCSDIDPHIPKQRVEETAGVLRHLGCDVALRFYKGMGHTVNLDEIRFVQGLIESVSSSVNDVNLETQRPIRQQIIKE